MSKNEFRKPTPKMHYADDGTPLGYLWQTAPGFDPFADWREGWKKKKKTAEPKQKEQPSPNYQNPNPYGYGEGRYMGD